MCRRIFCLAVAVILAGGCIDLSDRYDPFSTPRISHYLDNDREAWSEETDPDSDNSKLSLCGVKVPEGYDWRKDTAIGINPECKIVLYNGLKEVLSFPAGYDNCVSTDPDTHHLIEGHLYTEFSTVSSTVLKKDGSEILRVPGRFRFVGICPTQEGLFTLMEKKDGVGFSFYRDKTLVIERDDASVFGSFLEASRPETGALSLYEGNTYFTYKAALSGYNSYHVVKGNLDTEFPWMMDFDLCDLRVIGGNVYPLYVYKFGLSFLKVNDYHTFCNDYSWDTDTRLYDLDGNPGLAGNGVKRADGSKHVLLSSDCQTAFEQRTGDWFILSAGNGFQLVEALPDDWYIFTPGCLRYFGGELYCVKSPKDIQMKECLLTIGGNSYPIPLEGYLTGVSIH